MHGAVQKVHPSPPHGKNTHRAGSCFAARQHLPERPSRQVALAPPPAAPAVATVFVAVALAVVLAVALGGPAHAAANRHPAKRTQQHLQC